MEEDPVRAKLLCLCGALVLGSACADTTKLEAEVSDLKRRVAQLEKGGAKGAKAKGGKAKAGKAGKAKGGKAKGGKAKAGKAKGGKAKAPAGPKVVVELSGDATKVSLNNGKRGFSVPGPVPVGKYTIQAAFAGDAALADVGTLQVDEGSTITVTCASSTRTCSK